MNKNYENNFESSEFKDIYSSSKTGGKHSAAKPKKKMSKSKKIIIAVSVTLAVIAALSAGAYAYMHSILNNVNRPSEGEFNESEVSANTSTFVENNVVNIALYGIDTRTNGFKGRSDSIMILSVDKEHDKIKLISIARDSYVTMEGHGKDKITHAYAFGGAKLALKTLNQNFDMDITDYVTVNFFGITDIIDYLGGIELDVSSAEKDVMNTYYVPELNEIGIKCDYIKKTGMQKLSGSQALAYARNRYTGGDIERGNRQKEVLNAAYTKAKNLGITKYPDLAKLLLKNCETSLTNEEILELAYWAATNSPTIENFSLPDEDCKPKSGSNAMIDGVWYYIYDIDIAKQKIHDYIKEDGIYYKNNTSEE